MALTDKRGFALLEVLIAGIILAIGVLGLALMLGQGQNFLVAEGDNRVALYLTQQKLESLRTAGFAGAPVGNGTTTGCATGTEPCYTETVSAGAGQETPPAKQLDRQTFARLTCVRYVKDDNPDDPPETSPPTCPSCTPTAAPNHCTQQTKRIRVTVTPATTQADPLTLDTILTNPE